MRHAHAIRRQHPNGSVNPIGTLSRQKQTETMVPGPFVPNGSLQNWMFARLRAATFFYEGSSGRGRLPERETRRQIERQDNAERDPGDLQLVRQ
jgi:hypothetical protein